MSLYYVTIGKNEYQVNINNGQCLVNGNPVTGNLQKINQTGLHLLNRGTQSMELFMNSLEGDMLEVLMRGRRVLAKVETLQNRISRKNSVNQTGTLTAPMHGLIVKILVDENQVVEQGQTLIILESMKMQMQLNADCKGTVRKILVNQNDQIKKDAVLINLDPME
jgi:biotin carboxyl carrier protein